MSDLEHIQQKQIDFYEGQVTAVLVNDAGWENVYVVLKPLVESLGLSWSGQYRRIKRDPILDEVCMSVAVKAIDIDPNSKRPKTSTMLAVPLNHVNGFLFGINARRVKPEFRELLISYQRDCYRVLFNAFNTSDSMRRFYTAIGHDDKWIETRIKKHETGTDLTHEWLKRGVAAEHHLELTDEISRGAFGITTGEHRQLKRIDEDDNLQDNMSTMELLISAIGDETTRQITIDEDAQGVEDSREAAKRGGRVAGGARQLYEDETGHQVLTTKNHLDKSDAPALDEGDEQPSK